MPATQIAVAAEIARLPGGIPVLDGIALGYIGPDMMMPLGSALAATLGVVLLFWHRMVALVRSLLRRLRGRGTASSETASSETVGSETVGSGKGDPQAR